VGRNPYSEVRQKKTKTELITGPGAIQLERNREKELKDP